MADHSADILMITYNRPHYTRLSLTRLLDTCDDAVRVWLWHNGDHAETLEVVKEFARHPRVHEFHHSPENRKLREPTNWLWQNASGDLLGKVDDDCLVPHGWVERFRQAHAHVVRLGIVACWHFADEDFDPQVASAKIQSLPGGHRLVRNCWVGGSGYLMKRACVGQAGPIRASESFTDYCLRLASRNWINGWYYPLMLQEHMDDPRSPHTLLKSDRDLDQYLPLSARTFGVTSLAQWQEALRVDALLVQKASANPADHIGWRARLRRLRDRFFNRRVEAGLVAS